MKVYIAILLLAITAASRGQAQKKPAFDFQGHRMGDPRWPEIELDACTAVPTGDNRPDLLRREPAHRWEQGDGRYEFLNGTLASMLLT